MWLTVRQNLKAKVKKEEKAAGLESTSSSNFGKAFLNLSTVVALSALSPLLNSSLEKKPMRCASIFHASNRTCHMQAKNQYYFSVTMY